MTGWHTFGADWQPGSVTYYYDGQAVGTISTGITSAPMYLILTNTVASGQTATTDNMQVHYVRVWSGTPS
jgi:beta-glucanase (GH16 family)